MQAITVVFKSMKGKKKFYKLTLADLDKHQSHKSPNTEHSMIMT
jgi:hypothetical protein